MKIVIGYSGGIDSTYLSHSLIKKGYDVFLAHMNVDLENRIESSKYEEMKRIADKIGAKFDIFDMRTEFKEIVVDTFSQYYYDGKTPNPCIICNPNIKFKLLEKIRDQINYDKIGTGHYAKIVNIGGKNYLGSAEDKTKDQTYMLYKIIEQNDCSGNPLLDRIEFHLGVEKKEQIKKFLIENQIPLISNKESQNICFLPDNDYTRYIKQNYPQNMKKGYFVDTNGNILGEHKGLIYYTIGQRHGLEFNKTAKMFVTKIDNTNNTIEVGFEKDLMTHYVDLEDLKIISDNIESEINNGEIFGKVRYHHPISKIKSINGNKVEFEVAVRAPTPGQHCVIYKKYGEGYIVIGGGEINS